MRCAIFLAVVLTAQPAFAGDWDTDIGNGADWSGAYVGIFGGLGISQGRADLGDYSGSLIPLDVEYGLFPQSIESNQLGTAAGVVGGFNFQSGAFVGGIEADLGYVSTQAHHSYSRIDNVPSSPFPGVSTNTAYDTDFGALGTLRARAGYAFDNTLLYGTAGLALGSVTNRLGLALPEIGYTSPNWESSGLRAGYVIGVGIEHQMTSNVSLKFETLYVNLADQTVKGVDSGAFPGEAISYRFSNDVFVPRVGLTVQF